jgi:hypothetical protein
MSFIFCKSHTNLLCLRNEYIGCQIAFLATDRYFLDIAPPAASQSCSGASSVVNVCAISFQPPTWTHFKQDMRSLKNSVYSKIGKDPELVLAILPTSSTDIYHAIKSFGDVIAGVRALI